MIGWMIGLILIGVLLGVGIHLAHAVIAELPWLIVLGVFFLPIIMWVCTYHERRQWEARRREQEALRRERETPPAPSLSQLYARDYP